MGALDEGVHQVVALHAHRLHPARRETTRAGRRAWWPDGQAGEAVRAATTKSWRTRCSRHTDREHQRGGGGSAHAYLPMGTSPFCDAAASSAL